MTPSGGVPKSGYFCLQYLLLVPRGVRHSDSSCLKFKPHVACPSCTTTAQYGATWAQS